MKYPGSDPDPLFPWLLEVRKAFEVDPPASDLGKLVSDCISNFKYDPRYKDDPRFLKIWIFHLEGSDDVDGVLREMEELEISNRNAARYAWFAALLEAKEKWIEANLVYQIGIKRNAQPLDRLKDARALFYKRISYRMNQCFLQKLIGEVPAEQRRKFVNPWSARTMEEILKKIASQLAKYDGYHDSGKAYPGEGLPSLRNITRNKIIKLGRIKYQVKGCAGKGAFGQVFKACVDSNPDDVVALKIQSPAFPWEFHMYCLLDQRISGKQRSGFGHALRMHLYSDYSILVSDYLSYGTLQDAINSYAVIGKFMEEPLCMFYTIEMLYMLETLHVAGIIHGDFKPDNLLIRYSRYEMVFKLLQQEKTMGLDDSALFAAGNDIAILIYCRGELVEDEFQERQGSWGDQGLCLVDWGRGIDLNLFPDDVQFEGDCRTSGFRCIEMQEKRPWKFQVDTYGLCVAVHLMLHSTYMKIDRKTAPDGSHIFLPVAPFKRYWNVDLWKNLFSRLLNAGQDDHIETLQSLRRDFQDYLCSNNNRLVKQLKDLLLKQRMSLCSS